MLNAKIVSKTKDSEDSVTLLVDFDEDGASVGMRQSVKVPLNATVAEVRAEIARVGNRLRNARVTEQAVDAMVGQTIPITIVPPNVSAPIGAGNR